MNNYHYLIHHHVPFFFPLTVSYHPPAILTPPLCRWLCPNFTHMEAALLIARGPGL